MPDNNGDSGQAPTNADPGQAPHSGTPATPPAGQAPASGTMTQADYDRIIADLRKENAQHRTENTRVSGELKKLQEAGLTAEQKRDKEYTDMQTRHFEMQATVQRLSLENAGLHLAPTLGITDPRAAIALVQAEHANEIKIGDDGTPENLEALLKQVIKDHPVLAGQAQPTRQNAPNSGGASNPGRQAGNGGLTMEQIKAMPMRERMARMTEIDAWIKANPDLVQQWSNSERVRSS